MRARAQLLVTVLLLGSLLSSCGSFAPEWGAAEHWMTPTPGERALRQRYPDVGALLLQDDARMEIFGTSDRGFSVFSHHRAIRILDQRGLRYAYVVIPYGENTIIDDIHARTVTSSGTVLPLDAANIFDVTLYPNFVFFSDQRAKIFTLPGVEDGSIVEYSYTVNVHSRTLWHGWTFQNDIPTLRSCFTLVRPAEWKVIHKVYNGVLEARADKVPEGFKSTMTWEAIDEPPLPTEYGMPSRAERALRLSIAPLGFTAWKDVAEWYYDLAQPRTDPDAALRAQATRIVGDAATPHDKLRRIFDWVRDNVRYVAVEIGIGGFQPHFARDVCKNLYGDCKDMATLLCALGHGAGLNVLPVLVSTWQNGVADTGQASPLQFNHAIAYAPGVGPQGTWMDATEKGCPFGELPWYDQGLPVLAIAARESAAVCFTPRQPMEQNATIMRWDVRLAPNGDATVGGSTTVTGAAAIQLREELLSQGSDERQLWLETYLAERCPGVQVDSFQLEGVDPLRDTLKIVYHFRARQFSLKRADVHVLHPGELAASDLSMYFRAPQRRYPIRFRYGMRNEIHLRIPSASEGATPERGRADSLLSPFGTLRQSSGTENGAWRFDATLCLTGTEVRPEEYAPFRDFIDDVRRSNGAEYLLHLHTSG